MFLISWVLGNVGVAVLMVASDFPLGLAVVVKKPENPLFFSCLLSCSNFLPSWVKGNICHRSRCSHSSAGSILKEEVPAFLPIKLAPPKTLLADIDGAKGRGLQRKSSRLEGELEIQANKSVFDQRNDHRDKQEEIRHQDKGKLCGIIKARISDQVLIKVEEDPNFDDYQLDDPVKTARDDKKHTYDIQRRQIYLHSCV